MPSKDVLVIIPQTCEYVTFYGKMDFTDVIKSRILKGEKYPGMKEESRKFRVLVYMSSKKQRLVR